LNFRGFSALGRGHDFGGEPQGQNGERITPVRADDENVAILKLPV
jgi:hypothetical protein